MDTFYWHDYETWGVSPAEDRPSQFAGIRTDRDFNIIGESLNILCRPALDTLPQPEACLITGITPQHADANGHSERDFFSAIHRELSQPGTCGVGYNSIRFDDEVTRYGFYRNFYDPYAREWQNGSSRWDIIDMLRLCHAVRPEGIAWPRREDGCVSFRLERLTEENGLQHDAAHDALSDVYATIAVAKLVKQRQRKLFDHVYALRDKRVALQALALGSGLPRLHISAHFSAELCCGSLILPVVQHPQNKNEILCVDLRYSPQVIFDLPADELAKWLFTRQDNLPEGIDRIPLKSVHINRSPIVLTEKLVDGVVADRLSLDLSLCESHRQQLLAYGDLSDKLQAVAQATSYPEEEREVECALYDGFFSTRDRQLLSDIPSLDAAALSSASFPFEDARLPALLFRYRARNFPDSLSTDEQRQWHDFCRQKLLSGSPSRLDEMLARIDQLLVSPEQSGDILQSLRGFVEEKREQLVD